MFSYIVFSCLDIQVKHSLSLFKYYMKFPDLHAPLAYWHTLKEVMKIPSRKFHSNAMIYAYDLHIIMRTQRHRQSRDTNRNIKIGESVSLWRRANARNVRLSNPYWQYTDLFIFRFGHKYGRRLASDLTWKTSAVIIMRSYFLSKEIWDRLQFSGHQYVADKLMRTACSHILIIASQKHA